MRCPTNTSRQTESRFPKKGGLIVVVGTPRRGFQAFPRGSAPSKPRQLLTRLPSPQERPNKAQLMKNTGEARGLWAPLGADGHRLWTHGRTLWYTRRSMSSLPWPTLEDGTSPTHLDSASWGMCWALAIGARALVRPARIEQEIT